MHLASTEAYIVTGGIGALQTIDARGFRQTELTPGTVVWFTPGTIHRAINHDRLTVTVLMSNAGLPEAGDAVLTFPADIVADATRYAQEAALGDEAERAVRARRRRDLAVGGFETLRSAVIGGDRRPLEEFNTAAGALVRSRATAWPDLLRNGSVAQATRAREIAESVARGDVSHLRDGALYRGSAPIEQSFGMCGLLRPYDVTDIEEI